MGTASLISATATSPNPEWKPTSETAADLQGIIVSAYPMHLVAMFIMVQFPAPPATGQKAWVANITPRITDSTGERDICLNLAFSAAGLAVLGLSKEVLATFSRPFQEGMTTDNRARFLVDAPATWTVSYTHLMSWRREYRCDSCCYLTPLSWHRWIYPWGRRQSDHQ